MKQAKSNNKRSRRREPQKWMLPALILLAAAAVLLVFSYIKGETQLGIDAPVYQYFLTRRTEYDAGTKLVSGEHGLVFSNDKGENASDVTPIYYRDTTELILPVSMSWMDPSTGVEWAIPAFSHLKMDEKQVIRLQTDKQDLILNGGFLSDGLGTYVFFDETTLEVNGERMKLQPFSFCSTANAQVRVYQYDREELWQAKERVTNILISAAKRQYHADLTRAIYTGADGSSRILVASPKVLSEYRG